MGADDPPRYLAVKTYSRRCRGSGFRFGTCVECWAFMNITSNDMTYHSSQHALIRLTTPEQTVEHAVIGYD